MASFEDDTGDKGERDGRRQCISWILVGFAWIYTIGAKKRIKVVAEAYHIFWKGGYSTHQKGAIEVGKSLNYLLIGLGLREG